MLLNIDILYIITSTKAATGILQLPMSMADMYLSFSWWGITTLYRIHSSEPRYSIRCIDTREDMRYLKKLIIRYVIFCIFGRHFANINVMTLNIQFSVLIHISSHSLTWKCIFWPIVCLNNDNIWNRSEDMLFLAILSAIFKKGYYSDKTKNL